MATESARVEFKRNNLSVVLPMTQPTGKIRIKSRSFFGEYGNPVAVRQEILGQSCYAEWQIGYDLLAKNNAEKTSLTEKTFLNYKGETKYAYELSELVFYSYKSGLLSDYDLKETYNFIQSIPDKSLIDTVDDMRISRTNPIETTINGIDFYEMKISYPLIVRKFGKYDIYTEIVNKEKQKGVGVQPMLYVCIPITELEFSKSPLGRCLDSKKCAKWNIGADEAKLSLELFKLFGMLSKKHRFDVSAIMRMLFNL